MTRANPYTRSNLTKQRNAAAGKWRMQVSANSDLITMDVADLCSLALKGLDARKSVRSKAKRM